MEKKNPTDEIQEKVGVFINQTSKMLMQFGEAVRDQALKGRDLVEEKLKERELNNEFRLLGKEVFRLVAAGKLELPAELQAKVERIRGLAEQVTQEAEATPPPAAPPAEPPAEPPAGE
ncbi:MAG: hypothetical protein RBU37_19565 [Myxococcota bacterium]|jgi:hypothetical protein|nr:hypothetical protein [Myxococcota bacterium]